jgi:phytoene dehydrogenase-like protein
VGFTPWIAYWVLSAAGQPLAAVAAALAASSVLCAGALRRGGVKALELAALAFFGAHAALSAWLGAETLRPLDGLLSSGALALAAWGTLVAGTPFTAQYAREDWPKEYWEAPLFRRINLLLTTLWGVVFTLNATLGAASLAWPAARLWLVAVLPQAAIAGAVIASVLVPRRYPRRWAARALAAQNPYAWPPPAFPARAPGRAGHDVAIVGAGIGGLAAGALLARRGLSVVVLEQHYLAGGFCTSWPRLVRRGEERLRYVFDAGVHDVSGLGPRGPVRHLVEELGLAGRLDWRRVTHEYVLPGLRLKVPHGAPDLVAALAERFPAERASLERFFAAMEAVYRELYADAPATGGVPCPPRTVDAVLGWPEAHPTAFRWMNVAFGAMLDAHFRDPRLKELLSVLTGYLSDDPRALTVGAMAPIFGYYFDGGYYPAGGSQAFADALVGAIQEHGGAVRLRTPVSRILIDAGRAVGVELAGGERLRAEAVISNADARRTFLELVGPAHLPADFVRHVEALRPSASALAVFLGVDYVPDVEPITIQADDAQGLAIAVPSKVDPSLAPPGHSSVTLLTLVPPAASGDWDRKAPGYAARKRREGDALIARAERTLPGLRGHIVYRQDGTPPTFARYAWTTGGAIYGPAVGAWRPPAKSPVERLVLAGAGVFPGAGVEAVVISGTLAADAVCPAPGRAREAVETPRAAA